MFFSRRNRRKQRLKREIEAQQRAIEELIARGDLRAAVNLRIEILKTLFEIARAQNDIESGAEIASEIHTAATQLAALQAEEIDRLRELIAQVVTLTDSVEGKRAH